MQPSQLSAEIVVVLYHGVCTLQGNSESRIQTIPLISVADSFELSEKDFQNNLTCASKTRTRMVKKTANKIADTKVVNKNGMKAAKRTIKQKTKKDEKNKKKQKQVELRIVRTWIKHLLNDWVEISDWNSKWNIKAQPFEKFLEENLW